MNKILIIVAMTVASAAAQAGERAAVDAPGQAPVYGEMFSSPSTGVVQLGDLGGNAEPLQFDATRRLLVVCHEGKRVGNGTATMEEVDGRNMLVAKCEWDRATKK